MASACLAGVGAGDEWASHGGGADESGYSRLDEIKVSNINRLGLTWSLPLPDEVSLEATPLSVGGTIYFTGSTAIVYAVEAATGKLL
jgi:quinohemoprotein ethanol dehydrogenase